MSALGSEMTKEAKASASLVSGSFRNGFCRYTEALDSIDDLDYLDYLDKMTGKAPLRHGVSTRAQSALGGTHNPRFDIPLPNTKEQGRKPPLEGDTEHAKATSEERRAPPKSTQVDVNREEGQVPCPEEPVQNE
ncbi:hypothetical protein LIER_37994 [Lithospermum erythrorhizon]|uniref:Uncharacterized protein n=1 Tax=Lithospermum erythrorhizon TaxID=34254 RepID=A0AAV3PX31_LITER